MDKFEDRNLGIEYTGISMTTFLGNLKPRLTRGADGSQLHGRETFQDLFGILFPATGGIFAGASMSGDLKNPSKSIPKGTLYALATTFVLYTLVIFAMATTITRASFVRNANIIQETNVSGLIILAGELASSLFSTLMGVIGSAKLLQALARDNLLPGVKIFGQGTKNGDEPTYAIFITFIVAQITMLCNLNQIASFVTMTYLVSLFGFLIVFAQSVQNNSGGIYIFQEGNALTTADDLFGNEPGLFSAQNRLCAEFQTLLSLLQLADRPFRDCHLSSGYVLRGWALCYRLRRHPHRNLPSNSLHKSAKELGRCFTKPHLPSST
jgi:hypothetical protein